MHLADPGHRGTNTHRLFVYAFDRVDDASEPQIGDDLCSSLFEAHSSGLVHRDIKPATVMLNRRGGEPDFVKLLDFGLVKAVDDSQRGKSGDRLAGTPLYMSPESIQAPDSVDARSDLYAVGAVAYFLLSVFDQTIDHLAQGAVDQPIDGSAPSIPTNRPK